MRTVACATHGSPAISVRALTGSKVASDVMILEVKLPASEKFQFRAGQYIDFLLSGNRRRSFSIANSPHGADHLELHIRHIDGGAFTGQVFNQMKEKDILRFEGPLGSFFLREESAKPVVLLAGGTGFAPIKSIVEHVLQAGIDQPVEQPLFLRGVNRVALVLQAITQANFVDFDVVHGLGSPYSVIRIP